MLPPQQAVTGCLPLIHPGSGRVAPGRTDSAGGTGQQLPCPGICPTPGGPSPPLVERPGCGRMDPQHLSLSCCPHRSLASYEGSIKASSVFTVWSGSLLPDCT